MRNVKENIIAEIEGDKFGPVGYREGAPAEAAIQAAAELIDYWRCAIDGGRKPEAEDFVGDVDEVINLLTIFRDRVAKDPTLISESE